MPRPVGQLMGQGRRVRFGVEDGLERGHADVIGFEGIERPVADGADIGLRIREELIRPGDAFQLLRRPIC